MTTARDKWLWGVVGSGCLLIIQHFGSIVAPWFR
jgi:hypothetical protein